jgi:hypothetical protein
MIKTQDSNILFDIGVYMPYALFDRDAFIARTGLGPDMNVLIMGPDCPAAIQIARSVETLVAAIMSNPQQARGMRAVSTHNLSPIVAQYTHLPFKHRIFDIIFSYHILNNIPADEIPEMLYEVKGMLQQNSRFASMVWSLKPRNKAQSSHMMLLEILSQLGQIYLHGFDDISRWLEVAGFDEITMELVTHQISVPDTWVHSHIHRLDDMINENAHSSDINKAVESYKAHVKEYGEELLPSIQFTARRGAQLAGIDVVQ